MGNYVHSKFDWRLGWTIRKQKYRFIKLVEKYYVIQQICRKCYYDEHFLQIMKIRLIIFCGKEFSGKTKTFF